MTIKVTYNVTDVYMSQSVSPVYINVSYSDGGASGGGVWGSITGTLSNQTDLQTALDLKVPYSGATGNVNLGEYELKAGQVTLDTSPTGTAAVGTIRWNDTTGTSETTLKGGNVIIKNGVDLVARVVNKVSPNTTLTKAAYQAVRVSGAQGQRLAVALAQANNDTNSADTIGLVTETIATNQEGFIMTMGQLENINTTGSLQGETWVDGDVLYLSPTTAGAITNVQPTGSGHIVVIGYVEYAHANNGKIFVKVLNGWELTELHDTEIVNPLNNEGLFYNSTSTLWENKSITTALGYTPVPTTRNITINGVTYDLSADRTYTISTGISGSGAAGQVTYWDGTSSVSGSNDFLWDNTSKALTIQNTNSSSFSNIALGSNGGVNVRGLHLYAFGSTYSGVGAFSPSYVALSTGSSVTRLAYVAFGSTAWYTGGSTAANERMQLTSTGNLLIGFTTDQAVRLAVSGDTLLRGSGNTSATTALTVQNSDSTNLLRVRNDGALLFSNGSDLQIYSQQNSTRSSGIGSGFAFQSSLGSGNVGPDFRFFNGFVGSAITSGTRQGVLVNNIGFLPTSGTATYTILQLESLINQTGGANGITRGLYVNPTLTAAADFRAIETTAGNVLFGSNFFWNNAINRLELNGTDSGDSVRIINRGFITFSDTTNALTSRFRGISAGFVFQDAAFNTRAQISTGAGLTYFNAAGGGVMIGTSTDLGVRLGVSGDTILRGSGATSATTALTVQNSSSTNLFTVRNDGLSTVNQLLSSTGTTSQGTLIVGGASTRYTSNTGINTTGIYMSSAATDQDLFVGYVGGSATTNIYSYFQSKGYIGTRGGLRLGAASGTDVLTSITNTWLNIAAGTTTRSQINLAASTAPTTPNDGDIWFDGTDIKMRIGGVTKTFTLV